MRGCCFLAIPCGAHRSPSFRAMSPRGGGEDLRRSAEIWRDDHGTLSIGGSCLVEIEFLFLRGAAYRTEPSQFDTKVAAISCMEPEQSMLLALAPTRPQRQALPPCGPRKINEKLEL